MPGNTVVEDAKSTLLCPPATSQPPHLRPMGDGSISAAGVVHHSVVAISRRALPTAYYGIRCATGFSAVFSTWGGARPFIDGHHVSHCKFKTQHQATVFASYGVDLRTSPNAHYPRYVPPIVLDAPPADYRGRYTVPPPLDTFTETIMKPYLASLGIRDASQPDLQTVSADLPEYSTVGGGVNRLAQTGSRLDLGISVPHQSDALVVCPNGERPGPVEHRFLLPDKGGHTPSLTCTPDPVLPQPASRRDPSRRGVRGAAGSAGSGTLPNQLETALVVARGESAWDR